MCEQVEGVYEKLGIRVAFGVAAYTIAERIVVNWVALKAGTQPYDSGGKTFLQTNHGMRAGLSLQGNKRLELVKGAAGRFLDKQGFALSQYSSGDAVVGCRRSRDKDGGNIRVVENCRQRSGDDG